MIYLHNDNLEVASGDHSHHRSEAIEQLDRTWALRCSQPDCEDRILRDVEHSSMSAQGVPLTISELAMAEANEVAEQRQVGQLARALNALADAPAGRG